MSRVTHIVFIFLLAIIFIVTFLVLCYIGIPYYLTNAEERFFHPAHYLLKPSGILGHGLGIIGTLLMITGILTYMLRKRIRALSRLGSLKHWLEFHIFLCTLGPMMVLFHTSFKFGGIVAISFWSMVAVFLSGIIGRFIYIQIPRTIEGRELSLAEVRGLKSKFDEILKSDCNLDEETSLIIISAINTYADTSHKNSTGQYFKKYFKYFKTIRLIKHVLKKNKLSKKVSRQIVSLTKKDISLNKKLERLVTMQKLFNYWHVAHLPFAMVMLIIMVIHVIVTVTFGYKWIF